MFAESDIEETDTQSSRVEQFPNQSTTHSSTTDNNNFSYTPYISRPGHYRYYRHRERINNNNCNMCRTRSRRDQQIENICDDNVCENFREYRKRILHGRKLQKNDTNNKTINNSNNNNQSDNLSVAGPSRLIDAPVDYR